MLYPGMNHTYQVFGMHLACYSRKDASIMAKSPMSGSSSYGQMGGECIIQLSSATLRKRFYSNYTSTDNLLINYASCREHVMGCFST